MSTARYHFIIPSPADAPASAAGAPWLPAKLESPSHLLHAALHASGAGHLLRLNGREGGSPGWTGGQLVGVWDALARALRARAVSVEDVSSRGGVALRVLHAVAHGETWYGRWGYGWGRAPHGGSRTAWAAAATTSRGARLPALAAGLRAAAAAGDTLARDAGRVLKRFEGALARRAAGRGGGARAPPATLGALLDQALALLSKPAAAAAALATPAPGVVRSGGGRPPPPPRPPGGGPLRPPPPPAPTVPAAAAAAVDALPPMPGAVPGAPRAVRAALEALDPETDFPARVPPPASAAALAAAMAALRAATPAGGGWVPRATVRAAALAARGGDAAAVDGALAAAGGRRVRGAAVHRAPHPTTRALHYFLEDAGGGPAAGGAKGRAGAGASGSTPKPKPEPAPPTPTPAPRATPAPSPTKAKAAAGNKRKAAKAEPPPAPPPPPSPARPRLTRELASLCADPVAEVLPAGARRARGPGVAAGPPAGGAPRERPPPAWTALAPGAAVPPGGDAGGQLLRDVACLYDALLRPGDAPPLGPRPPGAPKPRPLTPGAAALASLAAAARVLHDVKHFVKDYGGHLPLDAATAARAAAAGGQAEGKVRVLVRADFDAPLPPAAAGGRGRRTAPPPEPVLVPEGASPAEIKEAARAVFAATYRLFKRATVVTLAKGDRGGSGRSLPSYAATFSGADPDPRWRHAGGPEDWTVACTGCGTRDDDGARMVVCDTCGAWVHTRCEGVPDAAPPPVALVCRACCASKHGGARVAAGPKGKGGGGGGAPKKKRRKL